MLFLFRSSALDFRSWGSSLRFVIIYDITLGHRDFTCLMIYYKGYWLEILWYITSVPCIFFLSLFNLFALAMLRLDLQFYS